ncbi:MAG: DUF5110 domain-containing protein, partial [Spirochaetia bacterium]|nr:DUF5110 domain-containing protein [Spirochaetia bacterium]
ERLFRSVIRTRYRLIPHYYSLGYQAQETGLPIVRSLEMVDPSARSAETQDGHASYFFVGDDMLVVCAKKARLPRGVWFNVRTGGVESAGTPVTWQDGPIPVFLRAPSMLPTARPSLTVVPGTHNKTIKVLCVPGGRAVYDLYDDDGEGSAYRNGEFSLTRLEGICERASVTLTVTRTGGSLETDRAFVFAIPGVRSLGHNAPAGQSGTAQWRYHRSRSILMVRFSPHKDAQQTFHLSGIDINPAFFA